MVFDPLLPYNDLPDLPPANDVETGVILKKTVAAGRMLAELKGLGETLLDQNILVNSILIQEAKDSSEIENIITTNDALFKAIAASSQANVAPATKEVIRYREGSGLDLRISSSGGSCQPMSLYILRIQLRAISPVSGDSPEL